MRIHTLGRIEVWSHGAPLVFASRGISRPQLLLAVLLAGSEAGVPKTHVTDQLWPEAKGDRADQSFRTTLHRLRGAIGSNFVEFQDRRVRLSSARVWDDGSHFSKLAGEWLEHLRSAGSLAALEEARCVLRLYEGDFLPAVELLSVGVRRDRLRGQFMALGLRIAEGYVALGRFQDALEVYSLSEDRGAASEATYGGLIRCQIALGQAPEALRTYARCKAWLHASGGAALSPEIERLKAQIAPEE